MVKRTLVRELTKGRLLDTLQAQSLLHRIAEIINSRPLTARSFAIDDFSAICPRDLLLGATPEDRLTQGVRYAEVQGGEQELPKRIAEVEARVDAWWARFSQDVFPLLVPRSTWRQEEPELRAGSIVLVRYEAKFGKDRFRLGRVIDTRRDADGLVRTAWVGLRSLWRAVREPDDVCKAGLTMMELPIQRLVLILPPEEQPAELLQGLADFPPMPRGGVLRGLEEQRDARGRQVPLVVQQDPPAEEIMDLPRPQREPRPRGRPRRVQ